MDRKSALKSEIQIRRTRRPGSGTARTYTIPPTDAFRPAERVLLPCLFWLPVDENPGLDTDGSRVANGQSGQVWFLAPNYGFGQSDVRYATIPVGKMLFIDLAGFFAAFETEDPGIETIEELRQLCADAVDQIVEVIFSVDGRQLQNIERYRAQSPAFEFVLPDNNIFQWWGIPVPAGVYYPGVADGYYAMLAPLSAGEHTIYIFADLGAWGTSEVTFHLTVE
jgi:hypothetical protein